MFPAKVMLNYGEPDDASLMGTFDRLDRPLVSGMTVPKLSQVCSASGTKERLQKFSKNLGPFEI